MKSNNRTVLCYAIMIIKNWSDKSWIRFNIEKRIIRINRDFLWSIIQMEKGNLIPQEWFIRKSTFTGQETFFPKERILERIGEIKNMKGDVSLDDLANMLSPNLM